MDRGGSRRCVTILVRNSGNMLSGQIPEEIFTPSNILTSLNLSRNQLDGELPKNLASLMHLSSLDLSQNKVKGMIA
ncbi:hypothetical protein RJ640_022491 [Escallonia rubra]|uniref:Uncharacterized protein n=1 Tax=Escallonia rubra TaxID=112253 RepID=A0AA88SF00_9ASTE|nr:hypothetical protein RJ640_022491 [Escallonia rubra]